MLLVVCLYCCHDVIVAYREFLLLLDVTAVTDAKGVVYGVQQF